jgi:hypothetical protein
MLIKHLVVETCISNSETGELTSIAVKISAALDSYGDQAEFQKFFIEEPSMSE